METAKLFMNGRSQAVRLPKSYRLNGTEVFIKKTAEGVLLIPKDQSVWEIWEQNLQKHKESFMEERNQQKREEIDALFD